MVCGVAYRQGSLRCDTCGELRGGVAPRLQTTRFSALPGLPDLSAEKYYLDGTGDCAACPRNVASWESYSGLVNILAAVIGLVGVAYVLFALLARYYGGSILSTMGHAGQLFAWAVLMLQGVAQVATVTSPSLPSMISRMFNSVSHRQGPGVSAPALHAPQPPPAPLRSSPCSTSAGSSCPPRARACTPS